MGFLEDWNLRKQSHSIEVLLDVWLPSSMLLEQEVEEATEDIQGIQDNLSSIWTRKRKCSLLRLHSFILHFIQLTFNHLRAEHQTSSTSQEPACLS